MITVRTGAVLATAAVAAVALILLRIVVVAHQLDGDVVAIDGRMDGIRAHADALAVLGSVDEAAKDALRVAAPLPGETRRLRATVGEIRDGVGAVEGSAGALDSRIGGIDAGVTATVSHLLGIVVPVESIESRLPYTLRLVGELGAAAVQVRDDAAALLAGPLLPDIARHAGSIDCELGPGGACR